MSGDLGPDVPQPEMPGEEAGPGQDREFSQSAPQWQSAGQPPPPAGQPPAGQPPYAPPSYVQPPYAQPPYAQPSYMPPPLLPGQSHQAGYWPQPPLRRSARGRVHALWVVVVLVAALAAGSGGYYFGSRHAHTVSAARLGRTAPGRAPTGPAPAGQGPCATTVTAAGPDSKLLAELLPLPAGATRPSNARAPKAYALRSFVAGLFPPQERSRETGFLGGLCFQAAVNSEWRTPAGTLVSIYLIKFALPSEARSYALDQEQADIAGVGVHGRHANVSGVPDAMIIQDPRLDKYGNTLTRLIGDVGDVAILVHVFVPALLDSEAAMDPLLREQASRL